MPSLTHYGPDSPVCDLGPVRPGREGVDPSRVTHECAPTRASRGQVGSLRGVTRRAGGPGPGVRRIRRESSPRVETEGSPTIRDPVVSPPSPGVLRPPNSTGVERLSSLFPTSRELGRTLDLQSSTRDPGPSGTGSLGQDGRPFGPPNTTCRKSRSSSASSSLSNDGSLHE